MDELSVLQLNGAGAKFPSKSHQEAFNHNVQGRAFTYEVEQKSRCCPSPAGKGRLRHSWQQWHSITSLLRRLWARAEVGILSCSCAEAWQQGEESCPGEHTQSSL